MAPVCMHRYVQAGASWIVTADAASLAAGMDVRRRRTLYLCRRIPPHTYRPTPRRRGPHMLLKMAKRMLFETDKRLLWKLAWNMGLKGMLSVEKHKRRLKRGEVFPPFLYVSIINSCNLRCQGCWVDVAAKQETIKPDAFHKLVREAKAMGNVFFGIVGGEPFMHPHLLDMLAAHPDCYFQIFTNGQFITDERAKRAAPARQRDAAHQRRGQRDRQRRAPRPGRRPQQDDGRALQNCLKHKVFTGVCTSLCQTNIDDLLDGEMGRSADRDGRDVHLVPRLPPDGAGRQPAAVPDAGAAAAGAQVRRRDAGEEADHHRRRLLRRRRPGPVPGGHRHHAPHQPVGRHRAVPDRAVHQGVDPLQRGRPAVAARQVPAIGVPARLPRPGPVRRRAAASCWSGRTC